MNDLTFRRAGEADAPHIVEFYNAVGGESGFLSFGKGEYPLDAAAQSAAIRSIEGGGADVMLLATDGEKIAGIATLNSPQKSRTRHDATLGIVVSRAYQGKGVGTRLISSLIEWARGNGVTKKISLITRADNTAAIRLYLNFGFVVEGRLINSTLIDGIYYDSYVMGLML